VGVKIFGGGKVKTGGIIIRQRGASFHPGEGTARGRDFTIFAEREGTVRFDRRRGKKVVYVEATGC
jgi:large subunit ribosomal protein L27